MNSNFSCNNRGFATVPLILIVLALLAGVVGYVAMKGPFGKCPFYVAPAPNFCLGGTIIGGGKDVRGCQLPPKCVASGDTSTSSATLTASWKTYRNEQYGFEVKYPSEWTVGKPVPSPNTFFTPPSSAGMVGSIWTRSQSTIYTDLGAYISGFEFYPTFVETHKVTANSFITLNGIKFYKYRWQYRGQAGETYLALNNGNIHYIAFQVQDDLLPFDASKSYMIFNQILSTFKFIEPPASSTLTDDGCISDSDCVVWVCAGAMSKQKADQLIARGVVDLPCRNFDNFAPKCMKNKCIAVPKQ